jgi:IS4 transposase
MTLRDIRFVGRMKTNARFEVQEDLPVSENGVLEDQMIRLSSPKAKKDCPILLRRIRFKRQEDGKVLAFIANDLKRSAGKIAGLYKERWQIELFFKRISDDLISEILI